MTARSVQRWSRRAGTGSDLGEVPRFNLIAAGSVAMASAPSSMPTLGASGRRRRRPARSVRPARPVGARRPTSAPSWPERHVEQSEEDDRQRRGGQQVPGPRPEQSQQGPFTRRPAEEHVVGAGQDIHRSYKCRVGDGDGEHTRHCPGSGLDAQTDHQEEGGRDDPEMSGDVFEEDQMREADVEVRREHALDGPGQSPEVGELDQGHDSPPARHRGDHDAHVAQSQGQRGGDRPGALGHECHRIADGVGAQNDADDAGNVDRPPSRVPAGRNAQGDTQTSGQDHR